MPRGVTQIGQFDVVTLNKGARDGLQDGNVLAVYKTGETVRDRVTGENVKIPDERSGLLMVFAPTTSSATARCCRPPARCR